MPANIINPMNHYFKFKLGSLVHDTFTGFQGHVCARASYLTGCDRYSMIPLKLDSNGLPQKRVWESEAFLELFNENRAVGEHNVQFMFNVGDYCTDIVTGFHGVVVCRLSNFGSINSYSLCLREPKNIKDDREWLTFDENLLQRVVGRKEISFSESIRKAISKVTALSRPGGPCDNPAPRNF